MQLFFEFFPIFLFFAAYKFLGIYVATVTAIVVSGMQFFLTWLLKKRFDVLQGATFLILATLGGTTLLLHEEIFIKWKPTVINWLLAVVFLVSHFIKKPLIKTVMQKTVQLPAKIWARLNLSWVIFWFLMGCLNLYIIYHFNTATWVDFKLFGYIGVTTLFIVLQAVYINRHMQLEDQKVCK
jgi:intracellular septation protein